MRTLAERPSNLEALQESLTIPDALRLAASRYGSKVAYTEGGPDSGRSLTWAGLWERSQAAAAGLVALGLQRGDRVAICAENSLDWITAFHAIVAAGASAVLVYHDLSAEEIRDQAGRPACRFIFASAGVLPKLEEALLSVIVMGPVSDASGKSSLQDVIRAGRQAPAAVQSSAPGPDDMAAIIYTSGTTAGPKGVMLSHRNLLCGAGSAVRALGITSKDSALLVLPLHHSLSFMIAVVLPMLIGGSIAIENNLRRIPQRLQENRPTLFFGVPRLYERLYRGMLSQAESAGRLDQFLAWQKRLRLVKRLTGLNLGGLVFRQAHKALGGRIRFLVSGAAPLKAQTALDFLSLGLPLLQGCGVTEAASAVAVQRFDRRRFLLTRYYEHHVGSVGSALPGVELRLADVPEKGISVARDGEGELQVRGPNVCLGYWQAQDATTGAMVDGWFRTGDVASMDRDGNVYITGRSKFVIVLDSGEKVFPDEVEAKIEESALVADVCVTGRRIRDRVVATAVVYPDVDAVLRRARESGRQPDACLVRELIEAEVSTKTSALAAYKRVGNVEITDEPLPKTTVGKVARGRLADSYCFDYGRWLASSPSSEEQAAAG